MRRHHKLFHVGLGAELRSLREINRISTRSVARAVGKSPAWVSRTETGERLPTPDEVAELCHVYGADADLRRQLQDKTREPNNNTTFLANGDEYSGEQANLTLLEGHAAHITVFELALVPGLLQTAEYAHNVISTVHRSAGELERRVSARLSRQAALVGPRAPMVSFFVDEFALQRVVGGAAVMRRQLARLVADGQLGNVWLRVVPRNIGAYPGLDGPFTLFEFPALEPYLYLENRLGGVFVTDTEETSQYRQLCDVLDKLALDAETSANLLDEIAGRLDDG